MTTIFVAFFVFYKVYYLKSPCPICSVQLQPWWLPGHTEYPFHPPENKVNTHIFTKMSVKILSHPDHLIAEKLSYLTLLLQFSPTALLMCGEPDRLHMEIM